MNNLSTSTRKVSLLVERSDGKAIDCWHGEVAEPDVAHLLEFLMNTYHSVTTIDRHGGGDKTRLPKELR